MIKVAAYNIMSGGFLHYADNAFHPARLPNIVNALSIIDADIVCLSDTYRWKELYTPRQVQSLLGYPYTYHIDIDDTRVKKGIGIAVASKIPFLQIERIWLGNRACIKAQVTIADSVVDVYCVYLDDMSESIRLKQIQTLFSTFTSDNIVLAGDFNIVSPSEVIVMERKYHAYAIKHPEVTGRSDYKTKILPVIKEFARAQVASYIKSNGFYETDNIEATAMTTLSEFNFKEAIFRVDHIFVNRNIQIKDFCVYTGDVFERASDHYPIAAVIEVK